ncbi:RC-LH1 core complex protein PufX [Flavimaricola marinus]|uniref:Intrinsic membrane protein PufX n=1 Tax=Flavimaricola marinus TaxID=1819565 RepID=A0A238LCC7_9RHOB|nr:RC-LH1 core complex protein PufX [Flavimaricola marinus]SMY07065.1 Intrinsic membrane protein PufX [Flavimaricola marinus]
MSDDNSPLGLSAKSKLSAEVTFLMLKGAGYAMVFVLAIWLIIAVIAAIGGALPDRAREAPDPTPWSALEVPALTQTDVV